MNIRKKLIYLCLISSIIMTSYLFIWNRAFTKIPIDQVYCPVNAGIAPDGTCGLYVGSEPSGALAAAGLIALTGLILLVIDVYKRKKSKK